MLSPNLLAFIGDAVFDLFIREIVVYKFPEYPVSHLHNFKSDIVCHKSQSKFLDQIFNILSQDELNIYKRGRNAKINHLSSKFSTLDYHKATGLEALFGYLFLSNNINRIYELICILI